MTANTKLFRRFWHCALTVLPRPHQLEPRVRNGKWVTSEQRVPPLRAFSRETENKSVTDHFGGAAPPDDRSVNLYQWHCESRQARWHDKTFPSLQHRAFSDRGEPAWGANRERRRAPSRGERGALLQIGCGVTRTGLIPGPPRGDLHE